MPKISSDLNVTFPLKGGSAVRITRGINQVDTELYKKLQASTFFQNLLNIGRIQEVKEAAAMPSETPPTSSTKKKSS